MRGEVNECQQLLPAQQVKPIVRELDESKMVTWECA